ncbi:MULTISPECIES: hypothetical protein [Erysipelotrichaceae]|uniref:hypothetical protein n=1 Tax=Erysipelotrichaceae TaxID=128827 RepID=UPI000E52EBA7|nr:hypothetical protein [Absiella sp. AM27-20]RHU03313.1 hypothetical protein DW716_15945 [Absiella sp. AM27-20]
MSFLDVLEYKYQESLDQSNTFTQYHKRYIVNILRADTGTSITFEYQCNPGFLKPTLYNCLGCLVRDAVAWEQCNDDIDEFQAAFGYTKASECFKAFVGCKENYNKLMALCGSEQVYDWLVEYYEDF